MPGAAHVYYHVTAAIIDAILEFTDDVNAPSLRPPVIIETQEVHPRHRRKWMEEP